jgi:hypothetical protein
MLTNHQVRDRRLDILRRLYRDVCALPVSIFEEQSFLALPQLLSAHRRGWHLWGDLNFREHLCFKYQSHLQGGRVLARADHRRHLCHVHCHGLVQRVGRLVVF